MLRVCSLNGWRRCAWMLRCMQLHVRPCALRQDLVLLQVDVAKGHMLCDTARAPSCWCRPAAPPTERERMPMPWAALCCPGCAMQDGRTPLHFAAKRSHVDLVRALLEAGANKEAAGLVRMVPFWLGRSHGWVIDARSTYVLVVLWFAMCAVTPARVQAVLFQGRAEHSCFPCGHLHCTVYLHTMPRHCSL